MFLNTIVNGLIMGSSYAILAIGLTLIYGVLKLINFAHGDVYTIGAFVGYTLARVNGANYWVAVLIGVVFCGVIGLVVERIAYRPLRNYPTGGLITSIGVSVFLSNLASIIWKTEPHFFKTPYTEKLVRIGSFSLNQQRIIVIVGSILLILFIYLFLYRSYFGRVIRAISQDPEASSLMGIYSNSIIAFVFALGSGLAGLSGVLVTPLDVVSPFIGLNATLKAFIVVVVGGFGNVEGTIIAGFLVGIIQSLASVYISAAYSDSIMYVFLILVLLIKPTGLFGRASENV